MLDTEFEVRGIKLLGHSRSANLWRCFRGASRRRETLGMILVIAALHIVGWFTLFAIATPRHWGPGIKVFDVSIGVTAYLLGMRHAFDADHIAAIDNTTRKLIRDNRRCPTVGFWFALGHSSVVLGCTALFAFGLRAFGQSFFENNSELHRLSALIGPIISAGFLYLIAALNMLVLYEMWGLSRTLPAGGDEQAPLERRRFGDGVISRMLAPLASWVERPWQIYFLGMLFGLGFDTATEIVLLCLANSGPASQLPWYATVCLPLLFAAGMTLLDTIDGLVMNLVYDSTLICYRLRVHYNLVITGASITVALVVATAQILGLFSESPARPGPVRRLASQLDPTTAGAVAVIALLSIWCASLMLRRRGPVAEG